MMMSAGRKLRLAAAGAVTVAVCACTPGGASTAPPSTVPPSIASTSAAAVSCSSRPAQVLLLSFARAFDAGNGDLVAPYFAAPPYFIRWVDPTLGRDYIGGYDYSRLGKHLKDLRRRGIRFSLLSFKSSSAVAGDSAAESAFGDSAAGFEFKIPYTGYGICNCVVRKITLMKW